MTKKKAAATRAPSAKPTGEPQPTLRVAMTGRASTAKAAEGEAPVLAYIATLPQPQRSIAAHVDALAVKAVPGLRRAVKWGMAYYGVDGGWCFSSGAFVGHVKVMFINGNTLKPEPPVTPTGMGKATRGVELASLDAINDAELAAWMAQAAAMPFVGAAQKKRAANAAGTANKKKQTRAAKNRT